MFSKSEARRWGDGDVDGPPAWWEGWPLTVVAIAFSALHWGGTVWALVKAMIGG